MARRGHTHLHRGHIRQLEGEMVAADSTALPKRTPEASEQRFPKAASTSVNKTNLTPNV